ncbi:Fruit protein [Acorus gramineus]|uniref:Fruit protein n=1 Tax=Acorus gramineus TaxID=55184 RepID=A0AAV9BX46_ACOGR|nr:Fruit protein [Acorus gramineus]
MSLLRRPLLHLRRRISSISAVADASVRQDTWTEAPLTLIEPASSDASLFHVAVDVSAYPDLASSHTRPGQYLQIRPPPPVGRPTFLAIASPPSLSASDGVFEFLVKSVPGSAAEVVCRMRRGDVVEVSGVMGSGFEVGRISPPEVARTVLIFATGSGISPIRALIESGFNADERSDVRLYYGARNLQRMAYQERFKAWESSGVRILPVLSQPDEMWKGLRGYVQSAFARAKQIVDPLSTGAVLCGYRKMTESVTSVLVADGVSKDKILKNF